MDIERGGLNSPDVWGLSQPRPVELSDEGVEVQRALVRGQLVSRLEGLWLFAESHMGGEGRPDPRFAELGLRCLDRIARLYRLDEREADAVEEVLPEVSRERTRLLILGQLEELEVRARSAGTEHLG